MDWIELLAVSPFSSMACNLPTTARKSALAINYGVGSPLSRNTV